MRGGHDQQKWQTDQPGGVESRTFTKNDCITVAGGSEGTVNGSRTERADQSVGNIVQFKVR